MNALAVLQSVGSGRIVGGWGYVWASYGIAWGGIALYALSLWLRRPRSPRNEEMRHDAR